MDEDRFYGCWAWSGTLSVASLEFGGKPFLQEFDQPAVHLDGQHFAGLGQEQFSQRAESGADLLTVWVMNTQLSTLCARLYVGNLRFAWRCVRSAAFGGPTIPMACTVTMILKR